MNKHKGGNKDDLRNFRLYYEELGKKAAKSGRAVRSTARVGFNNAYRIVAKIPGKTVGMARLRIMKRLQRLEDALRAPWLHDQHHQLEGYIRHIVRDEKSNKKAKKK